MQKNNFHSKNSLNATKQSSISYNNVEAVFAYVRQTLSKLNEIESRLDVLEIILLEIRKQSFAPVPTRQNDLIRGIKGLAKFLCVSEVKAQEIKNSGKIPFFQIDRVVLFESGKVIEAMNKYYGYGKK